MVDYTRKPLFQAGTSSIDASYWIGSRRAIVVHDDVILTEDGLPLLTEVGSYLQVEE
jgi:hypothetical protein